MTPNQDPLNEGYRQEIGKQNRASGPSTNATKPNEKRIETNHLLGGTGAGRVARRPTGNLWP